MFIKVDSLFNREWFLPYGMDYHLFAFGGGVIHMDSLNNRGFGSYFIGNTDTLNSIFMDFDNDGIETGYKGIPNNTISPEVKDNDLRALNLINDSTYLITAAVGPIPETVNPMGEWTMDSSGTVYNYQNHPGVSTPLSPTINTVDNKFMFMGRIQNTTMDILLYKLNADLTQAAYDTNTYVYDSLCDDHPIVSDTIYLDNCSIITAIDEIPTPQEYYSFIKNIPVRIFPNPATSGITFELGNTEKHKDIRISCFDINGKLIFEQTLPPGQTQITTTVSGWQSGMYIAVAGSSTGGAGSAKFVVRR